MVYSRFHAGKVLVMGLVVALALVLVVSAIAAVPAAALQSGTDLTAVYNEVSPSVVAISVTAQNPNAAVFGDDPNDTVVGTGSGFVLDTDGHIVTNNHVVDGATDIVVSFYDGTLVRATVVGLDPDSDLAVLKVDLPADKLHPATIGNSDELVIGETVLAIGSPFGQRWTLTSGIVSALDRTIQGLTDYSIGGVIQTDASINPGNSGGPLLDLEGNVVGVTSQIISEAGSSAGVGFAIPSNLTQRVAKQLIDNGFVQYSYLGIRGGDTTIDYIEALNLPNDIQGVVVSEVTAGSPAARAGLQNPNEPVEGTTVPTQVDIITAINDQHLGGIADLIGYLAKNTTPGDAVTLTVLRNGTDEIQLEAKLTPRPTRSGS